MSAILRSSLANGAEVTIGKRSYDGEVSIAIVDSDGSSKNWYFDDANRAKLIKALQEVK